MYGKKQMNDIITLYIIYLYLSMITPIQKKSDILVICLRYFCIILKDYILVSFPADPSCLKTPRFFERQRTWLGGAMAWPYCPIHVLYFAAWRNDLGR